MAGGTSATRPPTATAMPTWRASTPRSRWRFCEGDGFAQPNPRPMFANPPGLLRIEPHSAGLRERIWWGSGSNATSVWAARLGLNLQSSTLKDDETGEPLHVQQRKQIEAYREAWNEAGHDRQPRVSVSRSIFALTTDTDRAYFGGNRDSQDQIGMIDENTRAIFGRSYAAEPDVLVEQLRDGRGDPGGRHAAADRAQPARRRIQRSRHREHPHPRRAAARLALTPPAWAGRDLLRLPAPAVAVFAGDRFAVAGDTTHPVVGVRATACRCGRVASR